MTNLAQDDINRLLEELLQLREDHADRQDIRSYESFLRICLKIANLLVGDERLISAIAHDLSIPMDTTDELSLPKKLEESFVELEKDLEDNLRGFSTLLHWVLEENGIRHDPEFLLSQVPDLDKHILHPFIQLSNALLAYVDLDDVFMLNAQIAPTLLFLLTLTELYDGLFCNQEPLGRSMVEQWLKWRTKSDKLKELYQAALKYPDFKGLLGASDVRMRELVLVMICLRIAHGDSITNDEAPLIDTALIKFGMLGLLPLVDSGFLSLEEEDVRRKQMEKIGAKIVRVK